MATPVFVDTGAHYALADANDPDHEEAVRLLQQISRQRYVLVTSNFVISEAYTLLLKHLGWERAIHYVEELRAGATQVLGISAEDKSRAWEILRQDQDQDFSYGDATRFAMMERLDIETFFAFDAHFSTFRAQRGRAFTVAETTCRWKQSTAITDQSTPYPTMPDVSRWDRAVVLALIRFKRGFIWATWV